MAVTEITYETRTIKAFPGGKDCRSGNSAEEGGGHPPPTNSGRHRESRRSLGSSQEVLGSLTEEAKDWGSDNRVT